MWRIAVRAERAASCLMVALTTSVLFAASPAIPGEVPARRGRVGEASWYGAELAFRRTADGSLFNPDGLTGAHRSLPLGSRVRVTNLRNGRSVLVTITDRGPYRKHREIDVSYGAARVLGFADRGIERVLIEPL